MKNKYCNMCGKKLIEKQEDYLSVQKEWGYFSEHDQTIYRFHMCETCFQRMIRNFRIPVKTEKQKELL